MSTKTIGTRSRAMGAVAPPQPRIRVAEALPPRSAPTVETPVSLTDASVFALTNALTRLAPGRPQTALQQRAAAEFQRIRAELKTNFEL